LLNKSLLEERPADTSDTRLFLLQTLREFGLEQLAQSGTMERSEAAHAACFQLYVKQAILSRSLPFYDAPIEALTREYPNIRAALVACIKLHDLSAALRLGSSLLAYWTLCNLFSEGRGFLEQLLQMCPIEQADEKLLRILPMAYNSAGWLAYWQNDLARAKELVGISLELFQTRESTHWRGSILRLSALIEMTHPQGDFASGEALYHEGTNLHEQQGEHGVVGFSLLGLITLRIQLGELTENRALSQKSLELCREFDLPWAVAGNLHHLGWLALLEGDASTAIRYTREALRILKEVKVSFYLDAALMVYAFEQFALGEIAAAYETLRELLALARQNGDDGFAFHAYYGRARLALLQEDLEQATTCFEKAIAIIGKNWRENRTAWWLPTCLEGMAMIALRQNQPAWATRLLSAAHTRRTGQSCYFALGQEQPAYDQALKAARTALGEARFAIAWKEGRRLLPTSVLYAREAVALPAPLPASRPRRKRTGRLTSEASTLGLTPREIDTLRLLAQGLTNAQIAQQLVLSTVTVNSYLRSIYSKLDVTTRTAATRYALDHHLF
jgi:DNA-binding CsgD family transcriptional regulator/tetratricopeptide (TPR) repeat protein